MQGIARLILLGTFATIGIAIAFVLATAPRFREGSAESVNADPRPTDLFEPAQIAPLLAPLPHSEQLPHHEPDLEKVVYEEPGSLFEAPPRRLFNEINLSENLQVDDTLQAEPISPPLAQLQPPPVQMPLEVLPAAPEVERIVPPSLEEEPPAAEVRPSNNSSGIVINIQNTDIREVLDLLSQHGGLNIITTPNVKGEVSASLQDVDVMTALEAILRSSGFVGRRDGPFYYVGTREDFLSMDQSTDVVGTRVYRPNYVTSSELEQLIVSMLSAEVGSISVSSPSQIGIGANGDAAGGDDFSGSEVLIVRDYETVLYQIDQIVAEIDQPPLQVSIEAMILSVRLDDSNEFGVNFETLLSNSDARLISGSPAASLAAIDIKSGGLKFGFLDGNLAAFVNALETIGDTNVVASPRIMCMNKQPANILIGSQLGYVSTTVTENAATQSVDFLEVGTQLRIRPFISTDGMIRMEVHPELSTGTVRIEEGFTLPDKEVTQVTTNVMCRDGATLLIGGLIREDLSTTTRQIPLLGSMPYMGPFFRQKTETLDRREVIVLITSRIVYLPTAEQEGAQSAYEFQQRQGIYFDKSNPLGTRSMGLRHYRLAQAAWYAGDAQRALRYVNRAIHFNPLHRESINLHAEILAHSGFVDGSFDINLQEGLAPWEHPQGLEEYPAGTMESIHDRSYPPYPAEEMPTSFAPIHRVERSERP